MLETKINEMKISQCSCSMQCCRVYLEDGLSILLPVDIGVIVATGLDEHSKEGFGHHGVGHHD